MADILEQSSSACLTKRSERLKVLIDDLLQHGTTRFEARLRQVFAAHRREIRRKLTGDLGTPDRFRHTYCAWTVAIAVFGEHIERLSAKHTEGGHFSRRDREISRCLSKTLDDLEAACFEFKERFEVPDLKTSMAHRIFFWYSFTKQEAEEIASNCIATGTKALLTEPGDAA